jgi:hypothetical protein
MFEEIKDVLSSEMPDGSKIELVASLFNGDIGMIEREYLLNAMNSFLIQNNFSDHFMSNLDFTLNKVLK